MGRPSYNQKNQGQAATQDSTGTTGYKASTGRPIYSQT